LELRHVQLAYLGKQVAVKLGDIVNVRFFEQVAFGFRQCREFVHW
jgi:hypothetical protein